jgi:hypothetical protein
LVDSLDWIGLELEPNYFDRLIQTGHMAAGAPRQRRDSSGQFVLGQTGQTQAQLLDPTSGRRVGPVITLGAFRGAAGLPSRVGVVFFHRLTGCRVLWDLDGQSWCIEYP